MTFDKDLSNINPNFAENGFPFAYIKDGNTFISTFSEINLPASITEYIAIFGYCTNLTKCLIPNGVTSIGDNAFAICLKLTSITIPNSVTTIGSLTFFQCKSLTSVKIEAATPPTNDSELFDGCDALTEILVPSASVDAYKTATRWSTYANIIKGF